MMPPKLSKHCRAMLRGASPGSLRDHEAECDFCRDWLQRRARLTALLSEPIEPPTELRSAELLAGIRERIIESCEESPLGQVLDRAMPVDSVAESSAADALPEPQLEPGLVTQMRAVPVAAPEWRDVRESVLAKASGGRSRYVAGAGVAAAVVLSVVLLLRRDRPELPEITFTDVSSLSGVEGFSPMTVLRNGGRR